MFGPGTYDKLKLERNLFQHNAVAHEIILHLIHKLSFLLSSVILFLYNLLTYCFQLQRETCYPVTCVCKAMYVRRSCQQVCLRVPVGKSDSIFNSTSGAKTVILCDTQF